MPSSFSELNTETVIACKDLRLGFKLCGINILGYLRDEQEWRPKARCPDLAKHSSDGQARHKLQ